MRIHLAIVGCLPWLVGLLPAQVVPSPANHPASNPPSSPVGNPASSPIGQTVPAIRAAAERLVTDLHLEGAGLVVVRDGTEVHRSEHGKFADDLERPIGAASKWLGVATILTLVDAGVLDLDVPLARYVEEFDRSDKEAVTLRQCLACTSGVASRLEERLRGMDMKKFAAAAADAGLRDNPGAAFQASGVGLQLAAVAAERATGQTWHELFAARIAGPLDLQHTHFGTQVPLGGEAGRAAMPWIAGGAVSTLADYARFLQMLTGKGRFAEQQVLSETSLQAMCRDQVPPLVEVKPVGFTAEHVRYGLGTWLETLAEGGPRVTEPGSFGCMPWLDLDLGIGGVLAVRDHSSRLLPRLRGLQDEVRLAVQSPAVAGTSTSVTLAHGGRDRRYLLCAPPQQGPAAGLPLLVVLHGGGGNGEQANEATGLGEIGTRAGFVVVFPDGTGPLRGRLLTWNSGGIPVYASEHAVDDTGFLREVAKDVARRVAIDPTRIYAVGHSNGGMMCHRLAREAADVFAGIAVVSGAMNFTEIDAATPIAALLVHGTADEHVLLEGGAPKTSVGRSGDRQDASLQAAIDYYVARNQLRAYPETQRDGKVRIDNYAVGRSGNSSAVPVRVVRLEGGGHAWPGSSQRTRAVADQPFPFDASRAIVEFFAGLPAVGGSPAVPR